MLSRNVVKYLAFFIIYSFIGWGVEVSYHAIKEGKFINRGMLAGPICPIYGFGSIGLIYLLMPINNNIILVFLFSIFLCSFLELAAGYVLDKIFHKKWWDYSKEHFNIGGYICLGFSIYWGIGGLVLVRDIHKMIDIMISGINTDLLLFIFMPLALLMLLDFVYTVKSILKLNMRLKHVEELESHIRQLSDMLGENISEFSLDQYDKYQEHREEFDEKRQDLIEKINSVDAMKKEVVELIEKSNKRLLLAFPNMKERKYLKAIEELKKKVL